MIKTILYAIIYLMSNIAVANDDAMPAHYQLECVACHEQMVSGNTKVLYTRKDRLAKNYKELTQRVNYCKDQLELDWGKEQTRTVVEYLAKQYYQYPIP